MSTQITLDGRRMKIAVPIRDQEGNEWLDWVSVHISITNVLVAIGADKASSTTLNTHIDRDAARILARWILDNL